MRLIITSRWLQLFVAGMLTFVSTIAQNQNSSTDLAVQLGDDTQFEIPAFDGGGGGTTDFKLIKSSKPTIVKSPVVELNVKINRENEVVVIHLSVKLANEKNVPVGTYRLRYNEEMTAQELSNVGVEPVVLRVVKAQPRSVEPPPPIQPLLDNRTKAVEVVNFYRDSSVPDLFRLTLRNISTKGIMALDLFMPSGSHGGGGQRATGDRDHLVMAPGDTSEHMFSIGSGGARMPYGYVPDPPVQRTLIIRTVVFADGTYDGLIEPAAQIAAQRSGQNLQRKRILELIQQVATPAEPQPNLDDFKERVYELNDTADATVVREVAARFPTIPQKSLEQNFKAGLTEGKRQILRYIDEFESELKQRRSTLAFAQWLTKMQTDYERKIERF